MMMTSVLTREADMKAEEIRNLLRTKPFRPFVVLMPSGKEVPIIHHDFAYLGPDNRTLFAYQKDFSFDMLDIMLIEGIKLGPPVQSPSSPGSNGPATA